MARRRRYRNPPIEEALCEFHFGPSQDWDLTMPGKLQAALDDQYSGKPREQRTLQMGLHVQQGKPAGLKYDEGIAKVQLVSREGARMVGIGPDALSIHMLRPYQDASSLARGGWQEFEPRIATALDAYRKVAAPNGVARIHVRYINKISIPLESARIEEYLKCVHLEIDGLPERQANFLGRTEYVYEDEARLVLAYGLLEFASGKVICLLDLDVIWQQDDEPLACDASLEMAGELHERAGVAFETVITDKARELFDAG